MQSSRKFLVLSAIILVAALSRLIPHPMNFAPLGAIALFGAAYFGNKGWGIGIGMMAWFVSDLLLNNLVYPRGEGLVLFTEGAFFIYLSILIIYLLGTTVLQKVSVGRMVAGSLVASAVFFILSNLGVWLQATMYPVTAEGLVACYAAALPFFKNTLMGDLFFSSILFLGYEKLVRSQLIKQEA